MGKDRIIMHTWLKKISTALLTSLMLVSFIAVSVSASETNVSSAYTAPSGATLTYRSLIQKKKWESSFKKQGEVSGTVGKSLRLEGIQIKISSDTEGSVEYSTLAHKKGWAASKTNGQTSGGSGQFIERIRISLTGALADKYDIYYRVHMPFNKGWMGWAKNGEAAGVAHYKYNIEAIQIVLTDKDAEAPGTVNGISSERNSPILTAQSVKDAMTAKAQNYSSETNWLVLTDTKYYFTAVFKGSRGNWELVRFIYCAVGKKSSKTRKGSFRMKRKRSYFYYSKYRCKWASKYSGPYYYHSILYNRSGKKILDGRLGKMISHGCIRMEADDAKYIYKNVPKKSTVLVY